MEEAFCLLKLERLPWPYGLSLALEQTFSMGINYFSLAVWLGTVFPHS